MAIAQVRAQLNGQWYSLSYDSASATWQAELTPTETSWHQAGGKYNITLEATNETGQVLTVDGNDFSALLLQVLETTPPALTVVFPTPGTFQTTSTPTFVFDALDTGSGVDISTLRLTVDGEAVLNASSAAITDGYRISYIPASPMPEGRRTLVLTVSDNDGNTAELTAQYIIDTVPPALYVTQPYARHIFDTETITLSGMTNDETAPPVTVQVLQNGVDMGDIPIDAAGRFSVILPMELGENNTIVTATDLAGLVTTYMLYSIRLITDRTQADADRALDFNKRYTALSEAERAEWDAGMKGAYNDADMNRVTTAMEHLAALLSGRGYTAGFVPLEIEAGRTDWIPEDIPLPAQTQHYLANTEVFRAVFDGAPETPGDMEYFKFGEANDIEKILVNVDAVFPYIEKAHIYCGEAFSGEF